MTRNTSFKRRVRERMEKTGERYTAARAHLARAAQPDEGAAPAEPPAPDAAEPAPYPSDDAVRGATGRAWEDWFALLDAWGGTDHPHKEIAAWLMAEHAVPGWWAQSITVGYERARGLRKPGSGRDGLFTVNVTRTVAVPVERLYAAFTDPAERERWLPGAEMRERTARPHRTARYDWGDGATRVVVGFEAHGAGKSRVAMAHERLPDAAAADERKAYWRERLDALRVLLEGAGG